MLESAVEGRLKTKLESHGFRTFKFVTPGSTGTTDRLCLWPVWAPAPPFIVEVKRPGETPRLLQAAKADDWRARGVDVRRFVSTYAEVDMLVGEVLLEAVHRARTYLNCLVCQRLIAEIEFGGTCDRGGCPHGGDF